MRLAFPNTFFIARDRRAQLPALLRRVRPGRPGRLRRADDQRAPQTPSCWTSRQHDVGGDPGPDHQAGEDRADLGNILPIQDNPVHGGRADRDGRPDLGRADASAASCAASASRRWWANSEPGPQPRALRGVPRPDHQVLDRARARSAGRAGTTTSATSTRGACRCRSRTRRSGCRAPPARRRRCGPGAWGTPTCRSWCPFPIARELFDYYRQGAAEAGREVTPDKLGFLLCAVDRGHEGAGARGRPLLRVAHGPDPARPGRVLRAGRDALAGRRAGWRCGPARRRCRR